MIITLVFEKNANFFAENCQKSQKIVIITSVPGLDHFDPTGRRCTASSPSHEPANFAFAFHEIRSCAL
jgi:hypothetical protein